MSFGFSIGDILLVSQLAYKLYSSVTSGRRSAARDLKELGDVLFGLRCALDHLSKAAKDISAAASNKRDANAVDIRRKLDTMINSCGATLQELDTVTSKYREAANQGESDVVDHTADFTATGLSTNPNKKRSISQFKRNVRVNWMKIRWDVERNSLSEYRVKLQAHTDAINIVLNTFLWSATNRIEADGKVNAEKMHDLQNQALQSNTSLLKLVQEIHAMLLAPKPTPSAVPEHRPKPPQILPRSLHSTAWASVVGGHGGFHGGTIHSIRPHFGPVALMATNPLPNPTDKISTTRGLFAMPPEPPSDDLVAARHPAPATKPESGKQARQLPAAIVLLNERRQSTGAKGFKDFQEKYHPPKPPSKPSFLTLEIPTVPQLLDGIDYIFRPFPPATTRQTVANRDERKREIFRWTEGLDHLLNSWVSESISSPSASKEAKQAKGNEMVDLLMRLNGLIDGSDDRMKRVFYQGTEQGEIDGVLDKLQRVSKSVRGMKEVEEFEDMRGEWKESQNWG